MPYKLQLDLIVHNAKDARVIVHEVHDDLNSISRATFNNVNDAVNFVFDKAHSAEIPYRAY